MTKSEQINCPFCGNIINRDVYKCPYCQELFQEPVLNGFIFKELGVFAAIDLLTRGLFSTLWFFINLKAINGIATTSKDKLKLYVLIILLGINLSAYFLGFIQATIVQIFIYIALTYRVLRLIQKYTEKIYGVTIEVNPYYTVLFNIFYLIHYVETYPKRVQSKHEYFDWKSPQGIMLIILLLIIIIIARFYYEIYQLIS